MGTRLSPTDLQQALGNLPKWSQKGEVIERQFQFKDFLEAMAFVNKIADAAENANHHPDISISYNKVNLALTSHDSGGVTQRDVRMADVIDKIAA